jgi:formamidopyrimidine-DNA glycosylase
MPEVCEVALTAEILNSKLKGKTFIAIEFSSGRYGAGRKKPEGFSDFQKSLPLKVKKINSKGKFMWFELFDENNPNADHWFIWSTFGLTGMWSFNPQKFERLEIELQSANNKFSIYYSDMRNFGTFKFSQDKDLLDKKLTELGSDILKDEDINFSSITKYKKPIVAILMDQKKIGSGIGNYLVAEVLYKAKISPHRICTTLNESEIEKLTYYIKYMVKLCYLEGGTEYMGHLIDETTKIPRKNYHPNIHIKKKDAKFIFSVYRQQHDPLGNKVKAEKILKNRTTYWVPNIQK